MSNKVESSIPANGFTKQILQVLLEEKFGEPNFDVEMRHNFYMIKAPLKVTAVSNNCDRCSLHLRIVIMLILTFLLLKQYTLDGAKREYYLVFTEPSSSTNTEGS